jgi:hypothetical protein
MPSRLFVIVAALRLAASVYTARAVPVPRADSLRDWSALERTTISKDPQRELSWVAGR